MKLKDFIDLYWVEFELPYPFYLKGNQTAPNRYSLKRPYYGRVFLLKDGRLYGDEKKIKEIINDPMYDGSWDKPLELLLGWKK